jgi:hypothetical protein
MEVCMVKLLVFLCYVKALPEAFKLTMIAANPPLEKSAGQNNPAEVSPGVWILQAE